MTSLGHPPALWFTLSAAAVGLAITLTGLGSGFVGFTWSLLGGVLLGDIVGGGRRAAVWVLSASVLVGEAGTGDEAVSAVRARLALTSAGQGETALGRVILGTGT